MEATDGFVELVTASYHYLKARQDALETDFRLGTWPRWDWSQETGQLVFSADAAPKVIADFQFVGSVSRKSGTWLWSWANPWFKEGLTTEMREVRLYGEAHGLWQLTTRKWEADEVDGWEMTAIAAYILQAQGAYRTPDETGFTFLLLRDVRWAEEIQDPGVGPGSLQ